MDIEKAKKLKMNTELQISELLRDLHNKTKLNIQDLHLNIIHMIGNNNSYHVSLEMKI